MLGMLLAALDQTMYPSLADLSSVTSKGGSRHRLISTAYLLSLTVSTPLWARWGAWATSTAEDFLSQPRSSSS